MSRVTTSSARAALIAAATWLLGSCAPAPAPLAAVTLALGGADAATCEAHCADSFHVELFRASEITPVGPAVQDVVCGEAAPLGEVVIGGSYRVHAWANGLDGESIFDGWSDTFLVEEGAPTVEVTVVLDPTEVPAITSVSPEPLVLDAGDGTLTVLGDHFGAGDGVPVVSLGDVELDWQLIPGGVTATVPEGTAGGALAISSCAIASDPVDVRVLGDQPGTDAFSLPSLACPDGEVAALAALPDGAGFVAAASCDSGGSGELTPVTLGPTGCLKNAAPWSLSGGAPTALAADPSGATLYVALADAAAADHRVLQLSMSDGAEQEVWSLDGAPVADGLVATADAGFVIAGGALWTLTPGEPPAEVTAVDPTLDLRRLALAANSLFVAGVDDGALGLQVVLLPVAAGASPPVYPAGTCDMPTGLAVSDDGHYAVITCQSGRVVLVEVSDTATNKDLPVPDGTEPIGVAIDDRGELAFVWDATGGDVHVVDMRDPSGNSLVVWDLGATGVGDGLVSLGALDRLVLSGVPTAAEVTVLSPYDALAGCNL